MQTIKTDLSSTSKIIRLFRVGRIVAHTLLGLTIASVVLPLAGKSFKSRLIQWWCRKLLAAFNLQVSSHGHIPAKDAQLTTTMFVANHISWSDIHAINSVIALRFIAKSEIRNWPVFGYLVSRANTLFIDRSRKRDAKRTIDVAVQSLQAGDNLCLFPEGTTTDGSVLHPFKSSLIQAAIEAKASIRPVAIRYPHPDGGVNIDVAYAGETTLMQSMQKILSQKKPVIELHFLKPITAEDVAKQDRRELTLQIEALIRRHLAL
ncbi:lysophospholipid acyltransferase family protein [Methylotenera sp. G11]|uniref:lysophospholipid acyltransferase family protein n=1 Tax=Methylotenera sp. G11 TaxID=1506585 RepID=UPI0009DF67AA|nr:lysophospholipid acyltransferase family protein [Methylotenera sp. G11]